MTATNGETDRQAEMDRWTKMDGQIQADRLTFNGQTKMDGQRLSEADRLTYNGQTDRDGWTQTDRHTGL